MLFEKTVKSRELATIVDLAIVFDLAISVTGMPRKPTRCGMSGAAFLPAALSIDPIPVFPETRRSPGQAGQFASFVQRFAWNDRG